MPDSRYMADASLYAFVSALVSLIEGFDDDKNGSATVSRSSYSLISSTQRCAKWKSVSHSSVAWLEILLVDVALRNRDRFVLIWPVLELHYTRTLCGQTGSISYVHERFVIAFIDIFLCLR